eukprot:TRINITY_DN50947_c0_g1_i1.p2 TRINITY_DN50947_c0_g1~~TRINITY_DN50947_c0_g1_i1.p2  ORF type:complete len:464 (+),score=154.82 TRINITY_DN50947_c0_g1_i1:119-1393(+)
MADEEGEPVLNEKTNDALSGLVEPAGPFDADLQCAICLQPACGGVVTPCHHLFHKRCIDRSLAKAVRCPTCRRELDPDARYTPADRLLKAVLDKIRVKCPQDCKLKPPFGMLQSHIVNTCAKTVLRCQNDGCLVMYSRGNDDHSEVCPHAIVPCGDCDGQMKRHLLQRHKEADCSKKRFSGPPRPDALSSEAFSLYLVQLREEMLQSQRRQMLALLGLTCAQHTVKLPCRLSDALAADGQSRGQDFGGLFTLVLGRAKGQLIASVLMQGCSATAGCPRALVSAGTHFADIQGSSGEWPAALAVAHTEEADLAGRYSRLGETRNGAPVWGRGRVKIFRTKEGAWMVTALGSVGINLEKGTLKLEGAAWPVGRSGWQTLQGGEWAPSGAAACAVLLHEAAVCPFLAVAAETEVTVHLAAPPSFPSA